MRCERLWSGGTKCDQFVLHNSAPGFLPNHPEHGLRKPPEEQAPKKGVRPRGPFLSKSGEQFGSAPLSAPSLATHISRGSVETHCCETALSCCDPSGNTWQSQLC